jgi:hypothetical protein
LLAEKAQTNRLAALEKFFRPFAAPKYRRGRLHAACPPGGLKDDCMTPGYDIKVMPAKDGKTAKDVYLPNRKK